MLAPRRHRDTAHADRLRAALVVLVASTVAACAPPVDVGSIAQASHPCSSPLDACDDGDPCTRDSCDLARGECRHLSVEGCCVDDEDCAEGPVCTLRSCVMSLCFYEDVSPCLLDAGRDASLDAAIEDASALDGSVFEDAAVPEDASLVEDGAVPDDAADRFDAGGRDASSTPLQLGGGACAVGGEPTSLAWVLWLVLWSRRRARAPTRRSAQAAGCTARAGRSTRAEAASRARRPGNAA